MSEQGTIPTLTDLIEKGIEIKMSDLGLDDDLQFGLADEEDEFDTTQPDYAETADDPFASPANTEDAFAGDHALEQNIRRILDEHLELAFAEIKLAIQKSRKG